MGIIKTLKDAYADAIHDMHKAGAVVMNDVLPVLKKVSADASTIEQITALVSPQLANVEKAAESVLGAVIAAIDAGATAGADGYTSIPLDADLVSAVKAIAPAVKAAATTQVAAATAATKS